ncbi:MAG: CAP domain-containing protein [Chloroflexota bacterium]|nr:CAP domain-containing protein [Chloroflexota bacterium]
MRLVSSVAVAAVLAGALLGAIARPASAATLDTFESDLVAQVNAFRAEKGLPTLVVSDTLTASAKWMAVDMATENYFSHTSLDGRTPTQRMADAGYPASQTWTGEDLAAGYTTASAVLAGWINSPAHYAVLVNPVYRAIGVGRGYSATSQYQWYWAADFGGIVDSGSATVQSSVPSDPGFHDAWVGQSPDPTLAPGGVTTLVVALRNTGYRGWYEGVAGQSASLGTSAPTDVARPDLAYGWPSLDRITGATTSYVGPGEVGWFAFQVRAPATPGQYRLDVRGVVDGTTWLEDQGIYFTIVVQ